MGPADNRKLDIGDQVSNESGDFEVIGVGYREDSKGERIDFTYTVKDAEEVKIQKEADEEALRVLAEGSEND